MGPTGSGKTTLINALSRRGPVSGGDIRYGDQRWTSELRRRVAIVEQEDVVNESLTVLETLVFASELRLPARTQKQRAAAQARVADISKLLRLDGCAHTRVGDAKAAEARGVSGGERKRLCIAMELLPQPSLLFCDEPTSGLDSSMALIVASALSDLAKRNVTVICSIHQPSTQVFQSFDQLLLLDAGHVAYDGMAHDVAIHFATLGHPCPTGWSHADWMMEIVVCRKLETAELVAARPSTSRKGLDGGLGEGGSAPEAVIRNTWSHEVSVLLRRQWHTLRPKLWSNETATLHLVNGIIVGTCWYRTGYEEADIYPRVSGGIIIYLFWTFFPLLSAPAIVDSQTVIPLLRKEYAVGAFRLSAWWLVQTTVPMAKELLWPCLHVPLFWWLAGLNDSPAVFVLACLLLVLNLFVFNSFGILVAVAVPQYAMTVLLTFMTFFFTFTGMFVPLSRTPMPWLRFINPCYYVDQVALQLIIDKGHVYTRAEGPPITSAEVLAQYDVDMPPSLCIAVLLAFTAFCRFAGFLLLNRKMRSVLHSLRDVTHTATAGPSCARTPVKEVAPATASNGSSARGKRVVASGHDLADGATHSTSGVSDDADAAANAMRNGSSSTGNRRVGSGVFACKARSLSEDDSAATVAAAALSFEMRMDELADSMADSPSGPGQEVV